mgnify:FL=1
MIMKNFEFKSQVATSVEQSKRLLELGLKKETADCHWFYHNEHWEIKIGLDLISCENLYPKYYIPAWSLHRIIELMPEVIFDALLCVFKDSIKYEALVFDRIEVLNDVVSDNMYDNAIATIEWLIKEGYFNQDYLKEKKL